MPYLLAPRDPFADAKTTLSSWDNCMAKSYCKWPVIVAIVVGSLIILSVVFCVARCVCCGAELACCCFKCCSCCCPSGRSKHKRMKSDQPPMPTYPSAYPSAPPPAPAPVDTRPLNQQYRSHAAPTFNPAPVAAVKAEEPQFARFESTKPANEDALPHMPSWKDAKTSHVEEEVYPEKPDNIEMDRLDRNGSVAGSSITGAAIAGAPRRSPGLGRPPQRLQTQDTYGFPTGYQNDSFVSNAPPYEQHRNSPGPQGRHYGQEQDGYRGVSPVQTASPVYGAGAGYAQNQQYDRRSPGPNYPQTQDYDRRSPAPNYAQEQFRRPSPAHSPSPVNAYGYSTPPPQEPLLMPGNGMQRNESYTPTESTRYEPSAAPSYPGQQTYASNTEPAYPGQQAYQAFNPGQPQGQQFSGVTRKAPPGSWKDV
ncbi:hypothetical protein K458DRAFT_330205 [Lentithecium fluviatile CBS 122367]|uniref:Fibroin-3 related protein n=1 Tax=Lentithecium fluviatile CBS 122367 TaxID=1168545 RepID=A0A6G1JHI3_9PLEO|nr:hypothetical protein K458DRAFT_330205 [Lentithecium fluviatile CBS 122367]